MMRKIIKIDEGKCSGCGACAQACHEGAIVMEGGKAKLMHEHYCDGLGDCLPSCPAGAISFEMRDAPAYDEAAVLTAKERKEEAHGECQNKRTCPGRRFQTIHQPRHEAHRADTESSLSQWPVQIKLIPDKTPCFDGANLLIAADCCAYAFGSFHSRFIKNRVTLIGCPKLDNTDYSEKLTLILSQNNIKSLTIVRMEVPCCGGIEHAAKTALQKSGKFIPWQVHTITTDGKILEE